MCDRLCDVTRQDYDRNVPHNYPIVSPAVGLTDWVLHSRRAVLSVLRRRFLHATKATQRTSIRRQKHRESVMLARGEIAQVTARAIPPGYGVIQVGALLAHRTKLTEHLGAKPLSWVPILSGFIECGAKISICFWP